MPQKTLAHSQLVKTKMKQKAALARRKGGGGKK